ncbi:MAG: NYN domain-containing protein [Methylococcaceae bacterium]|nr:NYN domain-containing protein [Methylococcaceae bacterium]
MVAESLEVSGKGNRILLIDLENCPSQIQQLMKDLEQYSHVVVCYAQSGAKIPLDWIIPLNPIVNDNRLRIVKMPSGGKNAADFGITFWAGVLMAQLPIATHFTIVSNDADLDHVVNLLIGQQRSAERIGAKKEIIPFQTESNGLNVSSQDRQIQEYCLHLINHNKSRPAKKETLINNIKSKFKENGIDTEKLFNQLCKLSAIVLKEGNKIAYNEQIIETIANNK